jgi:NAD(P)-dependent dehydrogenase (short-subunit alcohol dehydrogenase family)
MDRKLTGRVAFVTGGGRGFGAGIAQGFAQAGARVCVTDIDEGELALSHQEIAATGGEVLALKVDVADFAQMTAAVEQVVARWGRLDVLVSNAATMPLVPFAATTPELWNLILGVNLTGIFNGVRAAWPHLVRQGGGHCIAIASGASVRGFVNEVAYCAAKHGLEGFTKALAMEAEPYNIAVNTMGPGKRIKPTSVTRAQAEALDPTERAAWVDPLTLAPAFVWLASQPPQRFTGLRFDAGPLADTIAAEGFDFAFSPEKVTIYPDDLAERLARRREWTVEGAR